MHDDKEPNKEEVELQKLRFDFAWKHFEFHAKQRTTMFQYFVTVAPLIVAAYFYFLKEKPVAYVPEALFVIAVIGAVLSIVFGLLDVRNRDLYRISEENLCLLEKSYLYTAPLGGFSGIICEEHKKYDNKFGYWLIKFSIPDGRYLRAFVRAVCGDGLLRAEPRISLITCRAAGTRQPSRNDFPKASPIWPPAP
jgi:hypothetical protein